MHGLTVPSCTGGLYPGTPSSVQSDPHDGTTAVQEPQEYILARRQYQQQQRQQWEGEGEGESSTGEEDDDELRPTDLVR